MEYNVYNAKAYILSLASDARTHTHNVNKCTSSFKVIIPFCHSNCSAACYNSSTVNRSCNSRILNTITPTASTTVCQTKWCHTQMKWNEMKLSFIFLSFSHFCVIIKSPSKRQLWELWIFCFLLFFSLYFSRAYLCIVALWHAMFQP